jgi:hypothetical protein
MRKRMRRRRRRIRFGVKRAQQHTHIHTHTFTRSLSLSPSLPPSLPLQPLSLTEPGARKSRDVSNCCISCKQTEFASGGRVGGGGRGRCEESEFGLTMGHFGFDTMVPWYHGTMVPWYHGTMVP